jgi:hypothetical protein
VRSASDLIGMAAAKLKKGEVANESGKRARQPGGTAVIERANYSLRFVASRKF